MATATRKKLHPTSIDIAEDVREISIEHLQQSVSDLLDLYSHFKQAHWNIKGPNFIGLHELFDTIAAEIIDHIDTVAERIAQLGGQVRGTVKSSGSDSQLPDYPLDAVKEKDHLKALVASVATAAKAAREAIDKTDEAGDADTADIFTAVSRSLDMRLWFLEAHLQG